MHWPWTSFLFMEGDRFNDWRNSVAQAASGDPYYYHGTPALAAYFPGAYLILGAASGLNPDASTVLYLGISECLLIVAIFAIYLSAANANGTSSHPARLEMQLLLVLSFLCSYPVLFALDRGNIDLWIACCCTLFIAAQGTRFGILGLAALAVAISAKGYPAAFLALILVRRDYCGAALCMAATGALSIIGLLTLHGGVAHNIAGLETNLHLYYQRYVLGGDSLFGSSDPYNAIRLIASELAPRLPLAATSAGVLAVYGPICSACSLILGVFVLAVPAPAWRRVTAVCLIAILFPNVASDYKLCCLMPALVLLLMSPQRSRREIVARRLFCLLMIPKSYLFLHGHSVSMLVNPVLLMGLGWQVVVDRAAWRRAWRLLPFRVSWYLAPMRGNSRFQPSLRLD